MKCPKCGAETKVADSRRPIGSEIHRRRACCGCGHRFNTVEMSLDAAQDNVRRVGFLEGRAALAAQIRKLHDQIGGLLT